MELGRLAKKRDIQLVLSKGRHASFSLFRAKILKHSQPKLRIAVIVSKKVSKKAVERNRIKRRLREALRLQAKDLGRGGDLALFPSKAVLGASFQALREEVRILAKKL